jgi:cytochrome c peroxidase
MSLVNVAYAPALTWANDKLDSLEEQMLVPMYGKEPIELGLPAGGAQFLESIRRDQTYQPLFRDAFPDQNAPYTMENVVKAIAAFERSIISMRSPYDRYRYGGDQTAISEAAKRGELLFFSSERAGCFQCHGGWNFSGPVRVEGHPPELAEFHNTGLYNLPGPISYPRPNTGLYEHTGDLADVGRFRAPTLRNIGHSALHARRQYCDP